MKKLGPLDKKLKWYVWQLVNLNQGSLSSKKIMIFKKIHTFHFLWKKLPLLLNLTQFYIPSHNSNLKMNLYEKLHFFMFYLDHQDNSKTLNNFFLGLEYSCKYTHNKMSNQETEDNLSWRLGIMDCNTKMGNETTG